METKTKCIKCDKDATFTQPDDQTGQIVDVCRDHFTWMYVG